jgi:phage terminase large subunit
MTMSNPNLKFLIDQEASGTRGVVLEGSSRSGKTWSGVDFVAYLAARDPGGVLNIIKETYAGFKTTIFNDINQRFPMANLPSPVRFVKECHTFRLYGMKINILGADSFSKFEGAGCDYFWINESLDVSKAIFDHQEMRCRRFWWMDYNPKVTDHYVYDLEKRPDVKFLHTTVLDNPYVSQNERNKIMSYEPTQENIDKGTADDYMWNVYGLGLRASPQGRIFKNINWITEFPADVERVWYGLDFGFTNDPTALVRIAQRGHDIYAQELLYTPIDNGDVLADTIAGWVGDNLIWCDAADKYIGDRGSDGMVKDMRKAGLRAYKAKKYPGSLQFGIDVMKRYRLNIVNTPNFKKEADNYKWRELNGISLNVPVDGFDHLWSALRYGCQMELAKRAGFTI